MPLTHDVFYLTFSTRRLSHLLEDAGWVVSIPPDQRDGNVRFVSDPSEGTIKLERVVLTPTSQGMALAGVEELTGRRQEQVQPRGQYL